MDLGLDLLHNEIANKMLTCLFQLAAASFRAYLSGIFMRMFLMVRWRLVRFPLFLVVDLFLMMKAKGLLGEWKMEVRKCFLQDSL